MLMRKPETSAVSTDRLRTWRRSTRGSAKRSSRAIHTASTTTDAATTTEGAMPMSIPIRPPSLSTTETPMTARLSSAGTDGVEAAGRDLGAGRQDEAAVTRAPATMMAPNQ